MDWLVDQLVNLPPIGAYLAVFSILLACGLGIPIPEDITLFAAGVAAYYKVGNVHAMFAIAMAGVLIGDSIIFMLGEKVGRKLTRHAFFARFLTPERIAKVELELKKRGNRLIFMARFMPGLRAPVFFSAGTLHLPYRVFLFYDGLAALISVPAIIYSIYHFGDQLEKVISIIKQVEHGIVGVIVAVVVLFLAKYYWKKRKASQE